MTALRVLSEGTHVGYRPSEAATGDLNDHR